MSLPITTGPQKLGTHCPQVDKKHLSYTKMSLINKSPSFIVLTTLSRVLLLLVFMYTYYHEGTLTAALFRQSITEWDSIIQGAYSTTWQPASNQRRVNQQASDNTKNWLRTRRPGAFMSKTADLKEQQTVEFQSCKAWEETERGDGHRAAEWSKRTDNLKVCHPEMMPTSVKHRYSKTKKNKRRRISVERNQLL